MDIEIRQENFDILEEYSKIPIAFEVRTIFKLIIPEQGLKGIRLEEQRVTPWIKDYDKEDGEGPTRWKKNWDVLNWGIYRAFDDNYAVGGTIIAFDTPNVHRLEGRKDIAALWDIRIHPDYRGRGIGTLLFRKAIEFARDRKCLCLKSETQNINVPACKFYQRQGCVLGAINRFAYWDLPNEFMLDWYFDLRE